jgi:hypothetical protein
MEVVNHNAPQVSMTEHSATLIAPCFPAQATSVIPSPPTSVIPAQAASVIPAQAASVIPAQAGIHCSCQEHEWKWLVLTSFKSQ